MVTWSSWLAISQQQQQQQQKLYSTRGTTPKMVEGKDSIPNILLDALKYDVSILDSLLKRHRSSHGRTIYFRRMKMTVKCLMEQQQQQQTTITIPVVEHVYRLKEFMTNVNRYVQELKRKEKRRQRYRNEQEEEEVEWCTRSSLSLNNDGAVIAGTTLVVVAQPPSIRRGLINELKDLVEVWTQHVPEILSRIRHSSLALIKEVSRGFFLPFCTVALAALARVRCIVMDVIGLRGLTILHNLQSDLQSNILSPPLSSNNNIEDNNNNNNNNNTTIPAPTIMTEQMYTECMHMYLEHENDYTNYNSSTTNSRKIILDRDVILRSLGLMKSSPSKQFKIQQIKIRNDIVKDSSNFDGNQTMMPLTTDSVVATTAMTDIDIESEKVYRENEFDNLMETGEKYHDGDDDNICSKHTKYPAINDDSLIVDRNMSLVDSYQKKIKKEKIKKSKSSGNSNAEYSKQQLKKREHVNLSATEIVDAGTATSTGTRPSERKKEGGNKRKKEKFITTMKEMEEPLLQQKNIITKKKRKKKEKISSSRSKNDFFDQLFD